MGKIESVEDFKRFIESNHDMIIRNAVDISELSEDDDWILDEEWDEICEHEYKTKKV